MNVFGAFTFGSLIKTFLPGLVWLVALALLWRDLNALLPFIPPLPSMEGEEQTLLVLAIPGSILLGLLSNIAVFMGVNDVLVRGPAKRRNPDLFALHTWLVMRIRQDNWQTLACPDPVLKTEFMATADAELLILNKVGIEELSYVREQYWYHMEFQVNLMLALIGVLAGLLASPAFAPTCGAYASCAQNGGIPRVLAECVSLGIICVFLRTAALKNYTRHVAKMCAVMTAIICKDAADAAAP